MTRAVPPSVAERRLYLAPSEFAGESAMLTGERAHRVTSVLRLRQGATLRVFDGLGHERAATLVEAARDRAVLTLLEPVPVLPEPPLPLIVCCAFPRGARGDWLVEKCTELGASVFVVLESDRGVMHAGDGRLQRWQRIAIEAAEQSGRAVVPVFEAEPPSGALALIADLAVARSPAQALAESPTARAIALYIGPEGGWTAAERAMHAAQGHVRVGLGPRPLRVETAAIALLTLTVEALRARHAGAGSGG